ncbi:MAG TPA: sulfite exporter TauE/SafE family protein [Solirubrobacterales bacterium]
MLGHAILGGAFAFLLAVVVAPVGVSGAVFLVPVQVSLLHTPSPSVTPTNLLYNVIATPGALARYGGRGIARAPLTSALVLGTLPGVIVGAVIRVELLAGPSAFYLVIAAVLVPLGAWLALLGSPTSGRTPPAAGDRRITALALLVGTIGGIYGIGGGSLLAPILVGLGFSVVEVAPAALASTFLTSIVGVIAYAVLSLRHSGSIAPAWVVGPGDGSGRPDRRLRRRRAPVPPPRSGPPPQPRRPRPRPRHPLRGARLDLNRPSRETSANTRPAPHARRPDRGRGDRANVRDARSSWRAASAAGRGRRPPPVHPGVGGSLRNGARLPAISGPARPRRSSARSARRRSGGRP